VQPDGPARLDRDEVDGQSPILRRSEHVLRVITQAAGPVPVARAFPALLPGLSHGNVIARRIHVETGKRGHEAASHLDACGSDGDARADNRDTSRDALSA